mgnify:CR=1 FL=1
MGHPIEDLLDSWMEMMEAVNRPHHMLKKNYNDRTTSSIGDWEERDSDIAITVDMPGVQKKDIELTVDKHSVRVIAKTEERDYSFNKDMTPELNPDEVTAKLNNGVLDITIQKAEESKGKKIAVK